VHANLSFVEPLLGEVDALPEGRDENDPWVFAPVIPALRSAFEVNDARVLCVVGAGVSASVVQELWSLQWAVIGDATVPHTLPYADPLLRDDSRATTLRPDIVVRLGGMPASKVLAQRLREWSPRVVGFTGAGFLADPDGIVSDRLPGLPDVRATQMRGSMAFVQEWASASRVVGEHLPRALGDVMSEIAVARAVVEAGVSAGVPLVVGSSMPVRDVEWWAPSRVSPVYSNRGANGIDGVVSTVLGVASGDRGLGLVGDVTFLHDVSALVDGVRGTAVLVVVDNSGGGIFNFLPQASALASDQFEELFATNRHHDLVRVASSFGHHAERVTTVSELTTAISAGLDRVGLTVIVATVPSRDENVAHHHALNESVAQWLS
jgi:2-succinyl-5-enolpyruvyl-6-hydroxy-3-cyclohexene-1-carboxylate synthase